MRINLIEIGKQLAPKLAGKEWHAAAATVRIELGFAGCEDFGVAEAFLRMLNDELVIRITKNARGDRVIERARCAWCSDCQSA